MKPSQRCHRCGGVVEKTLGDRWHECACGASCHRDENSALGLLDWGLAKWEKEHGFAFPGPKVVVYGKEWTGTDPCVEREALAGWNLAAGWKSASRAYSGETDRREARNPIPEPSGLDGVVHYGIKNMDGRNFHGVLSKVLKSNSAKE
ncbi:zinc ribbon domain-containing protein [Candidatus Methylacidiphilum fumarolicum]|uniref:zinc ribbon domain-containing protein n=4 Tax=Candidatus Methylacidiphilum fumarolicum TaxID=591154 RepID=UPI001C6649E7|nr:zinc ribbon domain-containing protein [Candidatus Methylacidiphilum fumarolicum]